jgi:hypothetical protein
VRVIYGRWSKKSASTYHSIACRTGKECRRKQGKLILRKLIRLIMRLPAEFSAGVTPGFTYLSTGWKFTEREIRTCSKLSGLRWAAVLRYTSTSGQHLMLTEHICGCPEPHTQKCVPEKSVMRWGLIRPMWKTIDHSERCKKDAEN